MINLEGLEVVQEPQVPVKIFGDFSTTVKTLLLEPTYFEVWQKRLLHFIVVIGNLDQVGSNLGF